MKKIFLFFSFVLLQFSLFTQSFPYLSINDTDVQNYIDNYFEIYDSVNELIIYTDKLSLSDVEAEAKFDIILKENGISGNNRIEKYEVISLCTSFVVIEDELSYLGYSIEDYFAETDVEIDTRDYQVVKKFSKEIKALYEKINFFDYDDYDYLDYYDDWSDYDDYDYLDYYDDWSDYDDYNYLDYYDDWSDYDDYNNYEFNI